MPKFNITTYTDWIRNTSILGSIRCSTLRSLDDAIKNYQTQRVEFSEREIMSESEHRSQWSVLNIRWSLEAWQKEQGPGQTWKSNKRNQMHSFTKLEASVSLHPNIANVKHSSYENNLDHTRLGVLYLLANLVVQAKTFNLVAMPAFTFTGGILAELQQEDPGHMGQASLERINDVHDYVRYGGNPTIIIGSSIENALVASKPCDSKKLYDILVEWVKTFANRLVIALKALFVKQTCRYGPNEMNWTLLLSIIKKLILIAVKTLLDISFAFIADTSHIIGKLTMVTDAAINCITTWWRARTVAILYGHPSVICESLKSAMKGDLTGELLEAIKSSITLSIMLLIPLGGIAIRAAINIIATLLETVYLFIRRQMKLSTMRGIFLDARKFWLHYTMDNNLAKTFALSEGDRYPLIKNNTSDFFDWFSGAMISMPELTALILNSGICGDKMHFLDMLSMAAPDHKMTEQDKKSFQEGLVYVKDLKNYSANLLRTSPYIFDSELPDIKGYISAAKEFTTSDSNKTWDNFKAMTNS